MFRAILILLMAAGPVFGQTIKLDVQGESVKVLVTALPFKIIAPPGADLYSWTFPNGVTAVESEENVLEVTAAPKGEMVVSVRTLTVDFESKKKIKTSGKIAIVVGEVVPPIPPVPPVPPIPPPPPIDEFTLRLKQAYDTDVKGGKGDAVSLEKLTSIFKSVASMNTAALPTSAAFYVVIKNAALASVGDPLKVLPTLRDSIRVELDSKLGPFLKSDTVLTADVKKQMVGQCIRVGATLEKLK